MTNKTSRTVNPVLIGLYLSGCVSSSLELASNDPADPSAWTGTVEHGPALESLRNHAPHTAHEHTDTAERAPTASGSGGQTVEGSSFTCPMHSDVVQAGPGNCPICGMKLTPKEKSR